MRNFVSSWAAMLVRRDRVYFAYLSVALVIFTFLVPPFQKPDEQRHYQSAISITNLDFICRQDSAGEYYFPLQRKYVELPDLMHIWDVWDLGSPTGAKFQPGWLRQDFSDPGYDETVPIYACNRPLVGGFASAHGPVLGYVPNALGLLLGKPFESPLVGFYLARAFGAVFFVVALALAIRVTPVQYRLPVYFYGALPTVLHQVSEISYDVVQLSLFPLIFACLVKIVLADRPVERPALLTFMALLLWMVSARIVTYLPLVLLIFAIRPVNIAPSFSRALAVSAAFVAVAALLTAVFSIAYLPRVNEVEEGSGIDPPAQAALFLERPKQFFSASYESLVSRGEWLIKDGIGSFGWGDTKLHYYSYFAFLMLGAIVVYRVIERDVAVLTWGQIGVVLGTVLLIVALLFFTLYVVASPVGGYAVEGLQGRYFVGLFPFAVLGVSQLAARTGKRRFVYAVLAAMALVVLHNLFWAVYMRFYG
jgi:uncharacterized membrane protein